MAFTEFYVQSTGSNLNAGSTDTDAATFTYAAGTFVRATGVFTVASGNPLTDGVAVGNFASVYTTAGATVATFVGRVTARDATTITVSTTVIAGATSSVSEGAGAATLKVGGAWAGPNGATAFPFNFAAVTLRDASDNPCRVNIKGTGFTSTASWTHTLTGYVRFEGYVTTVGDGGMCKFTGAATGVAYSGLVISGTNNELRNIWWSQNGDSGGADVGGISIQAAGNRMANCLATDCWRSGIRLAGAGITTDCEAYGNNLDDANGYGGFLILEEGVLIRCWSHHNNAGTGADCEGFVMASDSAEPVTFVNCISSHNGANGFITTGSHAAFTMIQCVSAYNGESGVDINSLTATTRSNICLENCLFTNNTQYGVEFDANAVGFPNMRNCGFFSNTLGATNNINSSFNVDAITLSGNPYVDGPNGNFALNNTAGAGADARNAGVGTFPNDGTEYSDTTISYPSVGAAEPDAAAPAGGQTSYTFG